MVSESRKRASMKYDQANTKQIKLKLNLSTDKDIIDQLEHVGNKQGYIKDLIRADMKSNTINNS